MKYSAMTPINPKHYQRKKRRKPMAKPVKLKPVEIVLGCKARDMITGYKGIVIGMCQYITGCDQVCLKKQGLDKDCKPYVGIWFDIVQLERVGTKVITFPTAEQDPGGPKSPDMIPPL